MSWNVEYTDQFGEWWEQLSEAEQESIAASVQLLEELGPHLSFPPAVELKDQGTAICVSSGHSMKAVPIIRSTLLIHAAAQSS